MKIALGVEYDGRAYSGWESQVGRPTVQAALERALGAVADEPVRTVCAGRTDAGVHALGQVVHFDSQAARTNRSWVFGANSNLPPDISVTWATPVSEDFHARFSARRRRYRYVILNRAVRPAALCGRVTWECRTLDVDAMRAAASFLIGEYDFSSFRAAACQARNPVRSVFRLEIARRESLVCLDVEANAFLHHMVRNIAGVLIAVGTGKKPPSWVRDVLDARDRAAAGVTAPASGLYLVGIDYPAQFAIPRASVESAGWPLLFGLFCVGKG